MACVIGMERPDSADAVALIKELDEWLYSLYSQDSCYCLSPEQLVRENVAFFVVRVDGKAVGCCGLRSEDGYSELKRMYVRPSFRGQGLAKQMLRHVERYAIDGGVKVIRIETGIYQVEAMALYERAGYHRIPRFGDYREDGVSVFFEKSLEP
jgi:putative acetyltransferase